MKKFHRTILFSAFLLLFTVSAPVAILYARGYRLDLATRTVSKTGGIFIKASEANADVFLGEKLKKQTDLFGKQAFITNLVPGEYQIEVRKDGYHTWRKRMRVESEKVTEARNILLLKQNLPKELIYGRGISDVALSENASRAAILTSENELIVLDTKTKESVRRETLMPNSKYTILDTSSDLEHIFLHEEKGGKYAVISINLQEPRFRRLPVGEIILEGYVSPQRNDALILLLGYPKMNTRSIAFFDTKDGIPRTILDDVAAFTVTGDKILALEKPTGIVVKVAVENGRKEQISPMVFEGVRDPDTAYQFIIAGERIALIENGTLWLKEPASDLFRKEVEGGVRGAAFSALEKTLLWWTPHEIWISILDDIAIQPFRKKGEKILITRLLEVPTHVRWYSEDWEHIFFVVGNTLKITEIDGRDTRNTVALTTLEKDEGDTPLGIWYVENTHTLYLHDTTGLSALIIR